ncbi:hypothetical protein INT44_004570, partial [Umbelopsis vinacea]
TAYLCRLTLGNNVLADPEQDPAEVDDEIRHAMELRQAVEKSEADVLATVGFYNAPDVQQESAENFAGFSLAVGSMIGNYVLCFPFVVARHRHQTVPQLFARQRDTPFTSITYLANQRQQGGWKALYPGFGLGLLAQGFAVSYESVLNTVISRIFSKATSSTTFLTQLSLAFVNKVLELAVYIPLHPIYRNALIVRTQAQTPFTQLVITSYSGFWRACKRDLHRFSPFSQPILAHNALPLSSVFIPSCILSVLSEKLLTIVYKHLHRFLFKSKHTEKRQSSRRQHQTPRPRTSSLRQPLAREVSSSSPITTMAAPAKDSSQDKSSKSTADETTLYSFYPEVVCGITSSILTRALVYPAETIVFRLMLQGSGVLKNDTHYTGFWNCVAVVIQEEGVYSGLYQGIGAWLAEVLLGYFILESSWVALRLTQWHLKRKYDRKVEVEWQTRRALVREE